VDNEESRLRWGTEQRLEFIEFRSFWEGGVRRADITERFGVSVPQASTDLSLYQKLAPLNLRYDSSEKRYVPNPEFAPRFMRVNADRYLLQLKTINDKIISLDDTWITRPPVDEKSVEILYQSMNPDRPEAVWRRITPHAFAHDGLRWHVRAFCHIESKFKDFILSRCRELRNVDGAGASSTQDHQWTTFVNVILKPNPELTESQRQTIAMDYDMPDSQVAIPVRLALLYYFEKRLRLDVDAKKDKPAEKPIVVVNWNEFAKARDAATA
jgi:hypothetical protein